MLQMFFSPEKFSNYLKRVKKDYYENEMKFPFDFNLLWKLSYSNKKSAVAHLYKNFIEDHDFTCDGDKIAMSPICFEWMFARKSEVIWELYKMIWNLGGCILYVNTDRLLIDELQVWIKDNLGIMIYTEENEC